MVGVKSDLGPTLPAWDLVGDGTASPRLVLTRLVADKLPRGRRPGGNLRVSTKSDKGGADDEINIRIIIL